ncbi:MAG: folate-binding protein [Pseudomonadota bacterium]
MGNEQSNWLDFLQQQGATIHEGRVADFGNAKTELQSVTNTNIIAPLTHLALLRASGSDSAEFLQGQTSNDVRHVDAGHHQLSSYCTPKGRMLALFTLFMRDDDYYLQLPHELLEAVQKRLTMFVMRSDVKLDSVGDELPAFGLSGPQAETLINKALGSFPSDPDQSLTIDGVTVLRRPGDTPRFICLAATERLTALWQNLATEAQPVGSAPWDLLEIRAGIPNISSGSVEAFVPQMLNLQLINGVNFKKGCYPGQEIVARMQYLGKLKRRMYRAQSDSKELPAPGTELFSPESASGQGAGKVVRAAPSPDGGNELLVVAEISSAEQQVLFLENENGPQLKMLELPYAFEQRSE